MPVACRSEEPVHLRTWPIPRLRDFALVNSHASQKTPSFQKQRLSGLEGDARHQQQRRSGTGSPRSSGTKPCLVLNGPKLTPRVNHRPSFPSAR